MKTTDSKQQKTDIQEKISYKGALFATTFFVGGGILGFIVLLFTLYMVRI